MNSLHWYQFFFNLLCKIIKQVSCQNSSVEKYEYVPTFNKCKFHFFSSRFTSKTFLGLRQGNFGLKNKCSKLYFLPMYILFWDAAVMIKISEIYIVLFFSKIYQAFFYNFLWIYFTTMMCVKHKIEPIHSRDKHIITKKIFGMVIH